MDWIPFCFHMIATFLLGTLATLNDDGKMFGKTWWITMSAYTCGVVISVWRW